MGRGRVPREGGPEMKKLLLPVDGSPSSRRAAELAVRMLSGKPRMAATSSWLRLPLPP